MAFNLGQYGTSGGDDSYFGGNADSFGSLFGDETTRNLEGARLNQARANTALASSGIEQIGKWNQAKEYAQAYQSQVKRYDDQQRRKQRSGLFGGALNVLGTAASFIPVAGPVIGAGLKTAGDLVS